LLLPLLLLLLLLLLHAVELPDVLHWVTTEDCHALTDAVVLHRAAVAEPVLLWLLSNILQQDCTSKQHIQYSSVQNTLSEWCVPNLLLLLLLLLLKACPGC
jgi:hypothetical protein